MKRIFDIIRDYHSLIFKVFLFVLSVGFIVYLFPREGKFKYEFQKGKPWQHADLIAPFNFPIYKTDAEISAEKEAIKKQQKVYFFRNENQRKKALEAVRNNFKNKWNEHLQTFSEEEKKQIKDKDYYYEKGMEFLNNLYEKGIIELHSTIENKEEDYEIAILENNVAVTKTLAQVYTIQEAYQALKRYTSEMSEPEQKLMVSLLEDGLRRNISYDQETNEYILQQELNEISPTLGMIQEGERIVAKGELLNDKRFKLVESLKRESESQLGDRAQTNMILLGQVILVSLMILSLACIWYPFARKSSGVITK